MTSDQIINNCAKTGIVPAKHSISIFILTIVRRKVWMVSKNMDQENHNILRTAFHCFCWNPHFMILADRSLLTVILDKLSQVFCRLDWQTEESSKQHSVTNAYCKWNKTKPQKKPKQHDKYVENWRTSPMQSEAASAKAQAYLLGMACSFNSLCIFSRKDRRTRDEGSWEITEEIEDFL